MKSRHLTGKAILALDLGGRTGYACDWGSGTQDMRPGPRESRGMMFVRFGGWLREIITKVQPDVVVYEQPHLRGGAATEVLAGMAGIVQQACAEAGIEYTAVHSATIKRHATGKGNASKAMVLDAAQKEFRKMLIDSNEADALWLYDYAHEKFGKQIKTKGDKKK